MFFIEASEPPILSALVCGPGGSMQDERVKTQDRVSSVGSGVPVVLLPSVARLGNCQAARCQSSLRGGSFHGQRMDAAGQLNVEARAGRIQEVKTSTRNYRGHATKTDDFVPSKQNEPGARLNWAL